MKRVLAIALLLASFALSAFADGPGLPPVEKKPASGDVLLADGPGLPPVGVILLADGPGLPPTILA
jgi:hypothetical protein